MHDELLEKIKSHNGFITQENALLAVVELHKSMDFFTLPNGDYATVCLFCWDSGSQRLYPCPTILAIEKELS